MKKFAGNAKTIIMKVQFELLRSLWDFIKTNLFEIEVFAAAAVVLSLYKRIPYINLIVSPVVYYLILSLIAIRLFSFTIRQIMISVMAVFAVMIFYAVNQNTAAVDMLADVVYFILCYLCLRMIIDLRKQL